MDIVVTDQFLEWMQDKGRNTVAISIRKVKSGWVGCVKELYVLYKAPSDKQNYERQEVEGIAIYVANNVEAKNDKLTLGVKKGLFFSKAIDVRGVDLRPWY